MINVLKNEVVKIEKKANDIGLNILWQDAIQDNLAIITNMGAGKVVALFAVEKDNAKYSFRAFELNVNKWQWATAEGFTPQQMYDKLGSMIFKPIKLDTILDSLS